MVLLEAAHRIAEREHEGQKYGDHDYYDYHLVGVALAVWSNGGDKVAEAVALLHDTIEDTKYSLVRLEQDLTLYGIAPEEIEVIVGAVGLLSRDKSITYEAYIENLLQDRVASKVKYYDSLFNMRSCVKDGNYERAKKYLKNLCTLKDYA